MQIMGRQCAPYKIVRENGQSRFFCLFTAGIIGLKTQPLGKTIVLQLEGHHRMCYKSIKDRHFDVGCVAQSAFGGPAKRLQFFLF